MGEAKRKQQQVKDAILAGVPIIRDESKVIVGCAVVIKTGSGETHQVGLTPDQQNIIVRCILSMHGGVIQILKTVKAKPEQPDPIRHDGTAAPAIMMFPSAVTQDEP